MDKLDYSRALTCDFVRVSNDTRATRELHAKINGNHVSMVHASVKLKLSCTVIISHCQFVIKWSDLCSLCKKKMFSCVDFQARHDYTFNLYRYKFANAPASSTALKVRLSTYIIC